MKTIALFGTSADPPTIGHQTILQWLSQHYDRTVVWASDNPFKKHQTPLKFRSQMLQLTIEDLGLNNISLHPELSDRYTLNTVYKAKEKWGNKIEFSLVIGADILPQIHSWYRSKELLEQVKVLIVPRLGYEIQAADLTDLQDLGGEYAIANLDAPPVSSSTYRLQQDQSLVTAGVRDYIEQRNLYGTVIKGKSDAARSWGFPP
jgi:nicotinate-nucleotide adenylyltransferase